MSFSQAKQRVRLNEKTGGLGRVYQSGQIGYRQFLACIMGIKGGTNTGPLLLSLNKPARWGPKGVVFPHFYPRFELVRPILRVDLMI